MNAVIKARRRLIFVGLCVMLLLSGGGFFVIHNTMISKFMTDSYSVKKMIEELHAAGADHSGNKWEFWPKSEYAVGAQPVCSNSTAYLLWFVNTASKDLGYSGQWRDEFLSHHFRRNRSKWTVLMDASDKTPECVPLIVSQNLDIPSVARFLTTEELTERRAIRIGRGFAFFQARWYHLFGGGKSNRASQWRLPHKDKSRLPYEASYLTPTGKVVVTFPVQTNK